LQALPRLRGIERNDDGDGETDTVELCIIEGDIVEARVTVQRAGLTIHAPSRERLRKVEPRVGPRSTRSRPGRPTSAGTAWHRRSEPPTSAPGVLQLFGGGLAVRGLRGKAASVGIPPRRSATSTSIVASMPGEGVGPGAAGATAAA
jgi:hypothetical protein